MYTEVIRLKTKKRKKFCTRVRLQSGLWRDRSWEAIWEGESRAPGQSLCIMSSTPNSMAALSTMGNTDPLTNCIAYWEWASSSPLMVEIFSCFFPSFGVSIFCLEYWFILLWKLYRLERWKGFSTSSDSDILSC